MSWLKGSNGDLEKELKKKQKQEEREKQVALARERQEMEEKNRRFQILKREKPSDYRTFEIIKDKETGVCYIWHEKFVKGSGNRVGFTVLLDREGKPFVDDSEEYVDVDDFN